MRRCRLDADLIVGSTWYVVILMMMIRVMLLIMIVIQLHGWSISHRNEQ